MQYFHFHPDNQPSFDTPLVSNQCQHMKTNKEQCKNRVVIGHSFCYVHKLTKLHLKIQKSNISNAGNGLYAFDLKKAPNDIIFRKGDKITYYNGEIINHDILNQRYGDITAPYAIELHHQLIEDAAKVRGIGSLINHANTRKVNCRFSITKENRVQIIATKNIKNYTELLINYGKTFKLNESGVVTCTSNKKNKC